MAEKKKKGFLSRIKDSLKIKKRGLSGANAELRRKRGRNLKSNTKMASFREDTKANKKLQAEAKDPNKKYTTYTKVTSKNKAKLSDQQKIKPKTKSSATKTKIERVKGKGGRLLSTRTAEGRKALNKQKARKRAQEMAKKRLGK
tara:strand:- start:1146 stop:1577 length:432 start_codon:yes stop_codon:yes gene_type:complete